MICESIKKKLRQIVFGYFNLVYGDFANRKIFAPDYLHLSTVNNFVKEELRSIRPGMIVLDAGCGDQRYKKVLPNGVAYVGLDYEETRILYYSDAPEPHIKATVESMPSDSNYYDVILCTEVMEHVESIYCALKEMKRVLKPGGKIIITVPFIFPEHNSPYDFRRFTYYGIINECNDVGFKLIHSERLGGGGSVFFEIFIRLVHSKLRSTVIGKLLFYFPGLVILPFIHSIANVLGLSLDLLSWQDFYGGVGIVCEKVR